YVWARQATTGGQVHMWGGDDLTTHPASNKENFRDFDRFNASELNTRLQQEWLMLYRIIRCSNYIINNAGRLNGADARLNERVKTTIAQAHYWRAFSYHQLLYCWGDVPLILDDVVNYNEPLAPKEQIMEQVIIDLKKAETDLPVNWTGIPWSKNGMNILVSEGAAKATLAYVYLSYAGWPYNKTEYYAQAAAKAKEVIDGSSEPGFGNGKYYYKMLDEYQHVHSIEYNDKHTEVLLATYAVATQEMFMAAMCNIPEDYQGGGWNDVSAEIKFWKNFPEGPRKEATFAPKTLLNSGLQDWWYDPNYGTPDARKVCSPWYLAVAEAQGKEFDWTKSFRDQGVTYYGVKSHKTIRLSEVFCWYAEATGRSGQVTPHAIQAINAVRNRADGEQTNRYSGITSPEELAEAGYNEHGWEIAGYMWGSLAPRYHDMFRMHRCKEHFEDRVKNEPIEVAPGVFRKELVPVEGTWSDDRLWAPYPANDAKLNPNLHR
ncbi:MAG: RagB/SusD family nutrient uptake outer membrane protein, partial [Tannerella sp.]|nr:RagB/SusD family nutrient uptake outer membrane protein [Tannerella sp.]